MVYLENTTNIQEVYIPRNDQSGTYASPYDKGYEDGWDDAMERCEEGQLESGYITVTADTQTVHPSSGYMGFDEVNIDATEYGRGKYDEGVQNGLADGKAQQKSLLASTAITENGEYYRENGWNEVVVHVPTGVSCTLQDKTVSMSGSYITVYADQGYDGLNSVGVNASPYGESKYNEGYESGSTGTKALMTSTAFTRNDTYENEDGWSAVTVDVSCPEPEIESGVEYGLQSGFTGATITTSSGYDGIESVEIYDDGYGQERYDEGWGDGYDQGQSECPSVESSVSYGLESGFTGVTITPSSGYDAMDSVEIYDDGYGQAKYDDGVADGEANILSGMTSTAFTRNDTYTNASGWSSVTVNVESAPKLEIRSYNLDANWSGESGEVYPSPYLGFVGFEYFMVNDIGYGQAKYNKGYNDGLAACPQPTLEQKSVTLTATTETVTPSQGYDGMSAVTVNASGLCQNYYSSGYTDGETNALSGLTDITFTRNGEYTNPSGWSGVTVDVKVSSRFITYRTNNGVVADIEDIVNPNLNNIKWFHAKNANGDDCHILGNMYLGNYGYIFFDDDIVEVGGLWITSASSNSIIEVTIPNGVEKIDRICGNSPITTITLPNSLEEIGFNAFYASMSLTSLTIPSGVTKIGESAFADCTSLPTIVIPDSVTEIGVSAFQNCPLSAITLGTGVQSIARYAFDARTVDRYSLKDIYAYMEGITWNLYDNVFNEYNVFWRRLGSGTLYVPNGHSAEYADWLNALPSGWTISDTL